MNTQPAGRAIVARVVILPRQQSHTDAITSVNPAFIKAPHPMHIHLLCSSRPREDSGKFFVTDEFQRLCEMQP